MPAPPPQDVISVVVRMIMGINRGCGMVGVWLFGFCILGGLHCSAFLVLGCW